MATDLLIKFANDLKASRELKHITLQQIAFKTKIDIKFLQAIEDAKFEILPEIYVRAFIKEYAYSIDLKPQEIISKYDFAKKGFPEAIQDSKDPIEKVQDAEQDIIENSHEIAATNEPVKEFNSAEINSPLQNANDDDKKSLSKFNVLIGVLILVIAVIVSYFSFVYEGTIEIIKNNETSSIPDDQRFEEPTSADTTVQKATTIQIISDSLTLSIQNSENVWIKVLADGINRHQKQVEKNSNLLFKAKKVFSVSIGNAGVVKMYFNNKAVSNIGKIGEIRNIIISPDTIRYYTVKRNESKPSTRN